MNVPSEIFQKPPFDNRNAAHYAARTMKTHHALTTVIVLLPVLLGTGSCDPEPSGRLWDFGGSTWKYKMTLWMHVDSPEPDSFRDLVYDIQGKIKISTKTESSSDTSHRFAVEDDIPSVKVRYTKVPDDEGDIFCEGKSGTADISPAQKTLINYTRFYKPVPALIPLSNGSAWYPKHSVVLTFGINSAYFDELVATLREPNGMFSYSCTLDDDSWTNKKVPPVLPAYQYMGRIGAYTDHWVKPFDGGIIVGSMQFQCVSNCEKPDDPPLEEIPFEEEKDFCDKTVVQKECDNFKANARQVCQNLEDWMIVESNSAVSGTTVTCGDADCSGAIQRNEQRGEGPWTAYNMQLDSACEGSQPTDYQCSVECYGWNP